MINDEQLLEPCRPGDADLTFDVDGLSLDSVVVYERDVMLALSDGFGWWIDADGHAAAFAPATEDARVNSVNLRYDFAGMDDEFFRLVLDKLELWRRDRVLVRVLSAPERVITLMRDVNDWLPFGRSVC